MKIDTPKNFIKITRFAIDNIPSIRTVQLVKLLYFIELEYQTIFGDSILSVPIVRINMGPVPCDYKLHFKNMVLKKIVKTCGEHGGTAYYPGRIQISNDLTSIEIECISEVREKYKKIIKTRERYATEIMKGLSYQTLPMIRLTKDEENWGWKDIGKNLFSPPYFTEKDRDPFWKERQGYRDYLKRSTTHKYNVKDEKISLKIMKDLKPFLNATNYYSLSR